MRTWIIEFCFLGFVLNVYAHRDDTHGHVNRHNHAAHRQKEDGIKCRLHRTMAWRECDRKVVCNMACTTEADCTFPYCNARGLCECAQAFCKTDRMCYSFGIGCHGNFTCVNRHCFCKL